MMQKFQENQKLYYMTYYKNDTIISKTNNDIGQADLIEIHIAIRQDAAPTASQPYSLGS